MDEEEVKESANFLLEKRFLVFVLVMAAIIAVFSIAIYFAQRYLPSNIVVNADIQVCLNHANALLSNACTAFKVTCKNSELAIDLS